MAAATIAVPLTDRGRNLMRHALGLENEPKRGKRAYRNHFCAGGKDVDAWEELVKAGYATKIAVSQELSGGPPVFRVSPLGVEAVTMPWEREPKAGAK